MRLKCIPAAIEKGIVMLKNETPKTTARALKSALSSSVALVALTMASLTLSAPAAAQDNDVDAFDGTVNANCTGQTPVEATPTNGRTGNDVSGTTHCIGATSFNNEVSGSGNTLGAFNRDNAISGSNNTLGYGSYINACLLYTSPSPRDRG